MMDGAQGQDAQARIAALEAALDAERAQRHSAEARIAALESARQAERVQFGLAERAARVGYWRTTLPDFHKVWSPGMYALLGMEPGSPVPVADLFFYQDDAVAARAYFEKRDTAIRTCTPFSERARIRRDDGTERIIDTQCEIEIGPDGNAVAIVGASQDVTQQIEIESERNRAQELHRIMTEAASDIITVYRVENGRTLTQFASAALGRMLGWTIEHLGDFEFFNLVHPDDIGEAEKLREAPPHGQSLTATYRVRHADGHYVWIEGTLSTVCDDTTGEVLYRVGIARNVNERKACEQAMIAARQRAEAANRAKSAFLANMSHELRTPLNAIIGFADVMERQMFGPVENPRYCDYVSSIRKSGEHLLDLINDILDVAKIESGKMALSLELLDLGEIVGDCVHSMGERAHNAGVTLDFARPTGDLTCRADRRAMTQTVLNLLSNAVKFTPAGGRVEIATSVRDGLVRIVVRDDGIGIAAEDLPRLGKPFEQVCEDPNLAKRGTGLGLAVVRALTEQHGGRLSIDSPERRGTIVTVEFPRYAVMQESVA